LPLIKQPVLVMQGRNDATIDPESGDIILEGVQSKTKALHWLEESGHIILLEDELDLITEATLAFMQPTEVTK
jgi:carboxylesterase